MKDLVLLSELKIPRCCFLISSHPVSISLHGFSDASEHAYAAVLYLSSTYLDGQVEVNLLCSKTRVAPTKKQTIPRLELLGGTDFGQACTQCCSLPTSIEQCSLVGGLHGSATLDMQQKSLETVRSE